MKALLIAILSLFLIANTACAPFDTHQYIDEEVENTGDQDTQQERTPETTGFREFVPHSDAPSVKQEVVYTPSGNLSTYEKLQKEELASPYHSKNFSEKFVKAYNKQVINEGHREFEIKIELKDLDEQLVFNYQVSEENLFTKISTNSSTKTSDGFDYNLVSLCENRDCNILILTLRKLIDNETQEQMSMMLTVQIQDARTKIEDSKTKQTDTKTFGKLKQVQEVKTETVVVVDGVAKSTLTVTDPNDPEKKLLVVETPVADTHKEAIDAKVIQAEGIEKVRLQGNNPKKGKLVVEVETKKGTKARLYIGQREKMDNKVEPQRDFIHLYEKAVLPIISTGFSEEKLPESLEVSARLEAYRKHINTLKYIKYFQSKKPKANKVGSCQMKRNYNRALATSFLTQMKLVIPEVGMTLGELTSRILNKVDAPIQTAYLLALESTYINNGFNADEITPYQIEAGFSNEELKKLGKKRWEFWSDASGPYQCITDTCRYIIRRNRKRLELAGLNPQVFYVTPMERDMYKQALTAGKKEYDIKRGTFRRQIFNSGRETEYAEQRKEASLHQDDARKYFCYSYPLSGSSYQ